MGGAGCSRASPRSSPWLGLANPNPNPDPHPDPNPDPNPNPNPNPNPKQDAVSGQLLPSLEALQRDPARAARIAAAGQRFAQEWLSFGSVVRYVQVS